MNDKSWERWGLHGGLLGVALLVTAITTIGSPPDSDADAAEVLEWYADNDSTIQLSTFLIGVAVIGIVWWFGSLWRYMRRAEGGEPRLSLIAAVGLTLSAGAAMVAWALNSAVAMRIDDVGEGARIFFAVQNTLLGMSTMADVILVGAVSIIAIRTKFLPEWLAYGGATVALVQLVGAITVATDNGSIAVVGFVAFLLWMAWIAAISLVLIERKKTPAAA